jgi:heme O synthase-like polyprenyltransferase
MSYAPKLFGEPTDLLGPLMFLSLLVVSASVCGLIFGAYAFTLLWEEKKTKDAIKLCIYTIAWMAVFVVILMLSQLK